MGNRVLLLIKPIRWKVSDAINIYYVITKFSLSPLFLTVPQKLPSRGLGQPSPSPPISTLVETALTLHQVMPTFPDSLVPHPSPVTPTLEGTSPHRGGQEVSCNTIVLVKDLMPPKFWNPSMGSWNYMYMYMYIRVVIHENSRSLSSTSTCMYMYVHVPACV